MVDEDLGQATIAYEDPDGESVEKTVQNEHIAYFQDHWIIKTDEDDRGRDVVRRIPLQRVHYVERSVEEFQEEVTTLQNRVQSVADDLRSRILGGESPEDEGESEPEVHRVDVETGERVYDEPGGGIQEGSGEREQEETDEREQEETDERD